ncbi:single-stranded DNA-binding protein, partial [Mycobacteroides abscessus]
GRAGGRGTAPRIVGGGSRSSEPADDPWGSAPASGSTAADDEPPF